MAAINASSGGDTFAGDPGRATATGTPAGSCSRNPRPLRWARRLLAAGALAAGLATLTTGAAAQTVDPGEIIFPPGDGIIIIPDDDPLFCPPLPRWSFSTGS